MDRPIEQLSAVAVRLTTGPFAYAERLLEQAGVVYAFHLDIASESSDELRQAHRQALEFRGPQARLCWRSTGVRLLLNDLVNTGTCDAGELLATFTALARGGLPEGEFWCPTAGRRDPIPLLQPERPTARRTVAAWGLIAEDLKAERYGAAPRIAGPTPVQRRQLAAARDFLATTVPRVFDSVWQHAHVVAVLNRAPTARQGRQLMSASNPAVPGAIFVSDTTLEDRLATAEALLHEAVHQRLYDLCLLDSLYVGGYRADAGRRFTPPWYSSESGTGRPWPTDRAVAALHVYTHLLYFWLSVLHGEAVQADEVKAHARRRAAIARERALILGATLADPLCDELSARGRQFLAYLRDCIEACCSAARRDAGAMH